MAQGYEVEPEVPGQGKEALRNLPPMGQRLVHGAFWTIVFSATSKVVTLGGQIGMGWLLVPRDVGLVALAASVASIGQLVSGGGLRGELIRRQESFAELAGQVFWLSLTFSFVAALGMTAVAPWAAGVLGESRLIPLILLLSMNWPVAVLPLVYMAALYRDLRFTAVAGIQCAAVMVQTAAMLALAAMGFGAYALVIPLSLAQLVPALLGRWAVGPLTLGRPAPRRWPMLLGAAGWLMANSLFGALQQNGPSLMIGLIQNSVVTGLYFWGFQVSAQALFVLAGNLQGVFFATFAKINTEPDRQFQAFRKACQTVCVATSAICILQALTAQAVIGCLFPERWWMAAGAVQWLSLGLLTQPVHLVSCALFMARGDYRVLTAVNGVLALGLMGSAGMGAYWGGVEHISLCSGIFLFIGCFATGRVAMHYFRRGWWDLYQMLGPVSGVTAASLAMGWVINQAVNGLAPFGQVMVVSASVLVLYAAIAWLVVPATIREVAGRISRKRAALVKG